MRVVHSWWETLVLYKLQPNLVCHWPETPTKLVLHKQCFYCNESCVQLMTNFQAVQTRKIACLSYPCCFHISTKEMATYPTLQKQIPSFTQMPLRIKWKILIINSQHKRAWFLSASLYVSKRGTYWDRLCRDVVGWLVVTRVHCGQTVHPRPIVTMEH